MNAGPIVPVPEQKMGTAYTAMAPSMVTVSDTLQQSEYATDVRLHCLGGRVWCSRHPRTDSRHRFFWFVSVVQPELWDILDSSDEEEKPLGDGEGVAAGMPPRYELNEEGEYKTAADMRAAYNQLRYGHTIHSWPRLLRWLASRQQGRGLDKPVWLCGPTDMC